MYARKRYLFLPILIMLILASSLGFFAHADWTMYQGDPTHTGVAYVEPVTNPQVLWKTQISTVVYSAPVVSEGVMYLGASDMTLHAIDATNGNVLWEYNTTKQVVDTPAIGLNKVFFGSDNGKVYALDKKTGAFVWSYTTGDKVESSPIVNIQGQIVYIGSDDGYLYALNTTNGALIWSFNCGSAIRQSPALDNGVVYVGCFSYMYAINATTGTQIWRYSMLTVHTSYTTSTCAVTNGVVYFGATLNQNPSNGKFIALRCSDGSLLWSNTIAVLAPVSCPAVVSGIVYVGSIDDNIYALNATTGTQIWHKTTGNVITSSPVVVSELVYIGSQDHVLYALNKDTGAIVWDYTSSSSIDTGIAVDNLKVFFFSSDPQFVVVYVLINGVETVSPSSQLNFSANIMASMLALVGLFVGFAILKNPDEWRTLLGYLIVIIILIIFAGIFGSMGF